MRLLISPLKLGLVAVCGILVATGTIAHRDVVAAADGSLLYTQTTPNPQAYEYFPTALAAGDVNGDGKTDMIAGAGVETVEGNEPGRVYIFSGVGGSLLRTLTTPSPPYAFSHGLGRSVAAGDVDGDGKDDIIAGAYVFSGADGSLLRTLTTPNPQAEAIFGASVAAGNVNGDGNADVIVSAVWETVDGAEKQGRAYVFSGQDGSLLYEFTTPNPQPWALFGYSVTIGDVNGDGKGDIIVGAGAGAGAAGYQATIYVFSGQDGAPLYTFTSPNPGTGWGFGDAVAAGDVNGDGKSDVIAGAYGETVDGNFQQGQAYVFSGADGSLLRTLTTPNPPSPFIGAVFGGSVAAADVNGDGKSDVIAGARGETVDGNPGQGRVYAFSGDDGVLLRTLTTPNPEPGKLGGEFGESVAAGDMNGDGKADLMVGASSETVGDNAYQGRAYAFNGVSAAVSVGGVSAQPDLLSLRAERSSSTPVSVWYVTGLVCGAALLGLVAAARSRLRRRPSDR